MNVISIRILLVEDNDADALLLEYELTDSPFGPFQIVRTDCLAEALVHIQDRQFNVVLLDLGLPDSQGLATLEQLHSQNIYKIPIVVLTGLDDEALGLRALQEGAEDYLVKGASRDSTRAVRYAVERKRATETFLAAERKLAMAVDAAELGIFDWNVSTGDITWSFHCARLLGLAAGDLQGTFDTFKGCVHPDDQAGMIEVINRSLEERAEYRHEYRIIGPDNTEHWIEARGKVFQDVHGRPERLMGTIMDVSQRKAAEEAARKQALELARLSDANLTPRELTLLKLIAAGLPNKRIAMDLKISITTVAKHRAHLMAKTQALNAADLTRISTLAGILPGS